MQNYVEKTFKYVYNDWNARNFLVNEGYVTYSKYHDQLTFSEHFIYQENLERKGHTQIFFLSTLFLWKG